MKKKIFLRGLLWSIFLLVPFVGKLELFYNNALMCRLFLWWHNCCIAYPVISYGYMIGVVISGVFIFLQHRKLYKQVKNMERGEVGGNKIYISEMPVTPFTIEKGGSTAYEYGQILLKSVKLLKAEGMGMSVTFVGEEDYKDLKRRITRVAEYKTYQKTGAVILCLVCLLFLAGMAMLVRESSYPKYIERGDVGFVSETGEYFNFADSDALEQAFRIDGQYVYQFRTILCNSLQWKRALDSRYEYEEWVLDYLQKDFNCYNPWTSSCGGCYCVKYIGATKEEYRGESWYAGYQNGKGTSLYNEKSQDSFWERRNNITRNC